MDYCIGCMEHTENAEVSCSCGFSSEKYIQMPHYLPAGTLLKERYLVGSVLGQGGFGITYIGRDIVLDMKVAIKEFYMSEHTNRNTATSTDVNATVGLSQEVFEKNKAKFLTEARTLAKLDGEEGVVNVKDFFEANNTAYIVMEFLSGETLVQRLKRTGTMTTDEIFLCMQSVFKSLSKLHSLQLVHRDISPDNIMLTKEGKVKLFDFGAAMVADQSEEMVSRSVVYKSGFAPEEQFYSKGQIGPWTDIYALCATMYYCITGKLPDSSLERLSEDTMPSPNELTAECSIAFSDVIMKGMAVRRKDRYQSIAELEAALSRAMEGDSDAEPATVIPEPEISKNGTVYAGKSSPTTDNTSSSEKAPEKKKSGGIIIALIAAILVVIGLVIAIPKLLKQPGNNTAVPTAPVVSDPTGIPDEVINVPDTDIASEPTPVVSPEITPEATPEPEDSSSDTSEELQKFYNQLETFTIYLNGKALTLPCRYSDLAALGWEVKDPAELNVELRPNKQYTYKVVDMSDTKNSMYVVSAADSIGYTTVNDAYIIGVDVSSSYLNSGNPSDVRLTDDLVVGFSSFEAFRDKMSLEPAETEEYSSSTFNKYYFSNDLGNGYKLSFCVAKDGSYSYLKEFIVELCEAPVDYSAIVDTPLTVSGGDASAYSMPYYLQLGRATNTVTKGDIRVGVPLSYYLDQGWTLSENPVFISSETTQQLELTADPRTKITFKVVNPSKKALTVENCIVYDVTITSSFLLTDDTFVLVGESNSFDLRTPLQDDLLAAYTSAKAEIKGTEVKLYPYGNEDPRYIYINYLSTSKNLYSVRLYIPYSHLTALTWE